MNLANWAELFLLGCGCVVKRLVNDPDICNQGEEGTSTFKVFRGLGESDGVDKCVPALILV